MSDVIDKGLRMMQHAHNHFLCYQTSTQKSNWLFVKIRTMCWIRGNVPINQNWHTILLHPFMENNSILNTIDKPFVAHWREIFHEIFNDFININFSYASKSFLVHQWYLSRYQMTNSISCRLSSCCINCYHLSISQLIS